MNHLYHKYAATLSWNSRDLHCRNHFRLLLTSVYSDGVEFCFFVRRRVILEAKLIGWLVCLVLIYVVQIQTVAVVVLVLCAGHFVIN